MAERVAVRDALAEREKAMTEHAEGEASGPSEVGARLVLSSPEAISKRQKRKARVSGSNVKAKKVNPGKSTGRKKKHWGSSSPAKAHASKRKPKSFR